MGIRENIFFKCTLTNNTIKCTEEDSNDDEGNISVVVVIYCGNTEKHENNCFSGTAQHFHRIFDRCVRLKRYVCLDVVLHCNSTERYPVGEKNRKS